MSAVELGNDVERCADDEKKFKLMNRPMDVSTETETPDFEECFKVKDDREPDLQRHVMFLSSRYHFSADDVNSGEASRLTDTVSRYH